MTTQQLMIATAQTSFTASETRQARKYRIEDLGRRIIILSECVTPFQDGQLTLPIQAIHLVGCVSYDAIIPFLAGSTSRRLRDQETQLL